MFGLDFSEILIIGVVALIVVGPKELPQLMRTVGQWAGKARRMAAEFQGQMNEAIREAELDDVRKSVDDLKSLSPKNLLADQFSSVTRTLDEVKRETDATVSAIGSNFGAGPATAGSAMSAFTVDDAAAAVGPAMAEGDATRAIDTAAGEPMALGEPVFDLTPAPGGPVEVADAAPDEAAPAEPKKEREA
ncbi:MAG: Sec-independent protein translocase protein TatB [Hyphomicrobiales bacterium]|nr:Sec-independent protein translocase protein TatB [Hyphomicrobiales bacterium]